MLASRSVSSGLNPGWGHCVVFSLGNTPKSWCLSMGSSEFNAGGNPVMD